jgi:hypothetical protein
MRSYLALLILASLGGCATLETQKADLQKAPDGVRVYPPKVYLFVAEKASWLVHSPDFENAYDIKPLTIFAKQDFSVNFSDSEMTGITANQDTTAILNFLQAFGQLGAQVAGAGAGVSAQQFDSNFGLVPGIYAMTPEGKLVKVN